MVASLRGLLGAGVGAGAFRVDAATRLQLTSFALREQDAATVLTRFAVPDSGRSVGESRRTRMRAASKQKIEYLLIDVSNSFTKLAFSTRDRVGRAIKIPTKKLTRGRARTASRKAGRERDRGVVSRAGEEPHHRKRRG
jgi:hypothetical protein